MAQKSINKDSLDEKSRLMLQIMKILDNQDVDTLKKSLKAVKKIESKNVESREEHIPDMVDGVDNQNDVTMEDSDQEMMSDDAGNLALSLPAIICQASEKSESTMVDLADIDVWSQRSSSVSTIPWESSSKSSKTKTKVLQPRQHSSSQLVPPLAPSKQRKGTEKIPDTSSTASSCTDMIPPTPGMKRSSSTSAVFLASRQAERKKQESMSLSRKSNVEQTPGMKRALSVFGKLQQKRPSMENTSKQSSGTRNHKMLKRKLPEQSQPSKKQKTASPSISSDAEDSTGESLTENEQMATMTPCDICGALRDRLDKHYKNFHNLEWDAAKARAKLQKAASMGKTNVHTCPKCNKVVRCLADHLRNSHQIEKKSKESHEIRKSAKAKSVDDQFAMVEPVQEKSDKRSPVHESAFIRQFILWLQTMKGKNQKAKNAQQHGSQALKVWSSIGRDDDDDTSPLRLQDITSEGIFDYVETKRFVVNPGTLRSYLGSFSYFLDFVKSTGSEELSGDKIRDLKDEVKNYSSNLKDAVAERRAEFALQEHEDLLPASVVHDFLNSFYLTNIENSILRQETFDGQKSYCRIRNALMAILVCTNAQRTSAVRDIRPNNVFKAKVEGDYRVFGVAHHKTSSSRGVANFSLEPRFYTMVQQFATQTTEREDPSRGDKKPMFLSFAGNEMTASNAAKSIKTALTSSGVMDDVDRKVTATMIRKLVTTLVREDEPELARPLAQQLNHSDKTNETNYQLKQSQKSSAKMVKVMSQSIFKAAEKEKREKKIDQRKPDKEKEQPAKTYENAEFNMPPKSEFVKRISQFSAQKDLADRAKNMREQRRANKFKLYLYGRRYRIVADFEAAVKDAYDIDLPGIVNYICPKVDDDPELQSDAVIYCVSEVANSFRYHPMDLTVETDPDREEEDTEVWESVKVLADSTRATNKSDQPVENNKEQQSMHKAKRHEQQNNQEEQHIEQPVVQQLTLHEEQPETRAEPLKEDIVKHKKKKWSQCDTEAVERIFFRELMESVETKRRVPKASITNKNSEELTQLVEKYGLNSLYEKLYSLRRKEISGK